MSTLSLALIPWAPAFAENVRAMMDQVRLAHTWQRQDCDATQCVLYSSLKPPMPFALTAKTTAILSVSACQGKVAPTKTMANIVKEEVRSFRADFAITDYLEDDGHPVKNNIASWVETRRGHEVGWIRFRFVPGQGGLPMTLHQAIVVRERTKYCVPLAIAFADHEHDMKNDQRRIIEELLE